ncbi:uncharacterized protein A4U43_C07F13790 [Asparagus officinalis]|uniref:Uncharacterized protein n=1 Tax=Asparagus officinalis TaxID=4686 RepID=A0A5P1EGZ8_ASPOF|nr:uncharacterized protein A4U43_C07F13790 [Asparagus officinalis]
MIEVERILQTCRWGILIVNLVREMPECQHAQNASQPEILIPERYSIYHIHDITTDKLFNNLGDYWTTSASFRVLISCKSSAIHYWGRTVGVATFSRIVQ